MEMNFSNNIEKDDKETESKRSSESEITEEDANTTIVYIVPVVETQQSGFVLSEKDRRIFRNLAIIQIMLGSACIGCGIAALVLCDDSLTCGENYCYVTDEGRWTNVAATIWGGVLVIGCAIFSLCQDDANASCMVMTKFVLKFVAGMTTGTIVGLEIVADIYSWECESLMIVHSISASLSFILLIVFLIDILYSVHLQCKCKCGKNTTEEIEVKTSSSQTTIANPQIVLPSGQTIVIEEQPASAPGTPKVAYREERRGSTISVIYLPKVTT
ncbi:uncharacterized protein LOC120345852 [Styela clava]